MACYRALADLCVRVTAVDAVDDNRFGKLVSGVFQRVSTHPELTKFAGRNSSAQGNISDLGGYYNELKHFVEGLQGKNDFSAATPEDAVAPFALQSGKLKLVAD